MHTCLATINPKCIVRLNVAMQTGAVNVAMQTGAVNGRPALRDLWCFVDPKPFRTPSIL